MRGCFLRRFGHDGDAEPSADQLGNRLERHAFLGDRMIAPRGRTLLQRETIDARGVEAVRGRPAVLAFADIGSGTFLPGWGSEIKSMPGTVDVLKGWVMYPQDAISVRIISVFIFLDADDRVLGIAASDGYGIE